MTIQLPIPQIEVSWGLPKREFSTPGKKPDTYNKNTSILVINCLAKQWYGYFFSSSPKYMAFYVLPNGKWTSQQEEMNGQLPNVVPLSLQSKKVKIGNDDKPKEVDPFLNVNALEKTDANKLREEFEKISAKGDINNSFLQRIQNIFAITIESRDESRQQPKLSPKKTTPKAPSPSTSSSPQPEQNNGVTGKLSATAQATASTLTNAATTTYKAAKSGVNQGISVAASLSRKVRENASNPYTRYREDGIDMGHVVGAISFAITGVLGALLLYYRN